MRKPNRSKNKHLTETEIELFCQSAKEVLTKIHDRHDSKKIKEKKEEEADDLSPMNQSIYDYKA